MNRGSTPDSSLSGFRARGFNEAPIHESGKFRVPPPGPAPARRFNEAPIHESGKCRWPGRDFASGPRFNEAPIHESGKL